MKALSAEHAHRAVLLLGFFALIAFTLPNRSIPPHYSDEAGNYQSVHLLREYGWSIAFLQHYEGTAGPLHAMVHTALFPITAGQLPYIRWVNLIWLLLLVWLFSLFLQQQGIPRSTHLSLSLLALPATYICGGMALTELAAMSFLIGGLMLLHRSLTHKRKAWKGVLALSAGLCIGLSILGRQTFLPVLLTLPLFFAHYPKEGKKPLIFWCYVAALGVSLPVFAVWGGLVAQHDRVWVEELPWVPFHGVLALCYALLFSMFLTRAVFDFFTKWSIAFGGVLLTCIALNYALLDWSFLPVKEISWRLFNEAQQVRIALLFGGLSLGLAIGFAAFIAVEMWRRRGDCFYWFMAATFLLIIGASVKISHVFGGRYVFQAAPFLIGLLHDKIKFDRWEVFMAAAGAAGGLTALYLTMTT